MFVLPAIFYCSGGERLAMEPLRSLFDGFACWFEWKEPTFEPVAPEEVAKLALMRPCIGIAPCKLDPEV